MSRRDENVSVGVAMALYGLPMLLALLSAGIVCYFFYYAFRRPQLVPRGAQNVGDPIEHRAELGAELGL